MSGRLVVLGSCGSWPEAGRACSGFLIEYDGFRIVIDLGYATLPRLLRYVDGGDVHAVIITHEHADHCVDLHALYRVRFFEGSWPALPLYAPAGVLRRVGALETAGEAALREVFDCRELPAGPLPVGPFRLLSADLPHFVLNAGVRLESPRQVIAYTGDAGPSSAAAQLGAGADLFIVEATLQGYAESPYLRNARQAGELAALAGARRLMLTHFWPGTDRAVSVAQAREAYGGEVLVAEEDLVLPLA